MADSFIQLSPDSTGKRVDTRTAPDGDHREVQVIGSPTTADVAEADATNGLDVDVTRIIPGTSATHLGKAVDSALGATDTGVSALAVRDDALAALTPVDGDYTNLRTDSTGALWVRDTAGGGAGVQYTEDDAAPANPVGTALAMVRDDVLSGEVTADGDIVAARGTDKGELYVKHVDSIPVTDNGGSLTVDGAVTANAGTNLNTSLLALEAGGNLAAAAASLSVLDDWDETDRAKVNTIAGQVGVQGGSGTINALTQRVVLATDQPTVPVSLAAGGTTQYAEDTAHVSGDLVTMAGAVQQSADAALSSDGDRSALQVDATGYLKVNIKAGAGGGIAVVDDAVFTPGTTQGTPAFGFADETAPDSVDEGDAGALRMTLDRKLLTRVVGATDANRLDVDGSGHAQVDIAAVSVTVPVSAAALPLPTGASTLAEQQTQTTHLATIAGDTTDIEAAVELIDDTVKTLGTDTYTEATTKGLLIGAVRRDADTTLVDTTNEVAPLQVDANGRLKVEAFSGETLPVSLTSTTITGAVDTELPAAAALADNTANPTVPAVGSFLMAFDGTNWDRVQTGAATGGALKVDGSAVTQPVSGTVTANQGTAGTAWEIIGDVASDAAVPTNPVIIGARASTAQPTAVSADGDSVNLWANRKGAPIVSMAPHVGIFSDPWALTGETAQYTTTQTSTVLVAGGGSERLVVTKVQIQAGGTTAGTLQLYFGTGAYSRGTNLAIFDGEFAPSATLKPGVVMDGPFISAANGDDLLVTTSAAINPLTITVWYYIIT